MHTPDYTVTSKILRSIGHFEYARAVIENTVILHNWEQQLQKEARILLIEATCRKQGLNIDAADIKKLLETESTQKIQEVHNINEALTLVSDISKNRLLDEDDLKYIHKTLAAGILPKTKQGVFRSTRSKGTVNPEAILAELVETYDWINSVEGQETHPLILAGILKFQVLKIAPFESFNETISDLVSSLVLRVNNYKMKDFISIAAKDKPHGIETKTDIDLTSWLDIYTEYLANEAFNVQEKVKLLAKDTKVAKASGRASLTERQQKIIEYIHDYGMLQNKDFTALFPNKSEDSILRDLKALIDKKIIVKLGSTKSSRYELL